MKSYKAVCGLLVIMLLAGTVLAQQKKSAGVGFELATRFLSPTDSRFQGGSSVFRLNFPGTDGVNLFFERESVDFTFTNTGGTPTSLPGRVNSEGIGVGVDVADQMRFELLFGRGTTTMPSAVGTALNSSDMITHLGFYWSYPVSRAYIDVGLLMRSQTFGSALAGNVIDTGSTSTATVESLSGTMINIGIGYAF